MLCLGQGDRVTIPGSFLQLRLVELQNRLCPSVYGSPVACFWEGELVGRFQVLDAGSVVASFAVGTRWHRSAVEYGYSFYATDGYDPGKSPEEARMELRVTKKAMGEPCGACGVPTVAHSRGNEFYCSEECLDWDADAGVLECDACARPVPAEKSECARCHDAFYCSAECQRWDWEEDDHAAVCDEALVGRRARGTPSRRGRRGKGLSSAKAREILRHGSVRGHKLTAKQRRFFGWVAGGRKPRSRKRR